MNIVQYFKYKKDNVVGVSINIPEGATILETMDVLCADSGKDLVRISENKNVGTSIWLRKGDVQENYKEVKQEEIQPEKENVDG